MIDQIKLIIAGALIAVSFLAGFYVEHLRFDDYKEQIEAAAKVQQVKVEEEKKNDAEITKSIVAQYESKLASLQYSRPSGLFHLPKAASGVDGSGSYAALVVECQQTTIQLNSLQDWVNQQYKSDQQ